MSPFRTLVVVSAFLFGLQALPAQAQQEQSGDLTHDVEAPPAFAMIGDLLIARPLLIAATAVGAVVFVVALPFAAAGGGIGDAGKALVVDPGRAAFARCLGCTGVGYNKRE
ncbi:multidrug transporter [Pseudomonas sp. 10B1]|uniref:multidrug transporter n=1 Tax=unclassified Pseudomonas TaxID=196821 RepID=UPI002AB56546|nr:MULTISPECIES: multidrug transporter [unclassified Pseudomonas]MDY7562351.1 multidrug transporter [Pseudomonas sp. AB6]MEA9976386.1 multidrug transporter [Pseudomonas sp. RTS4]MEA9994725.1 multidrug transporter [Pseudomonas sp. AA4]MEB0086388.1 multidrug transporter [Pseudomonas sp. RTI1]MEB0126413.1 multidrug transporter [Pseudomonas sp. CCC1.2]